jgi:hypothetical protein
MDRQLLLVAILGICVVNGLFSPFLPVAIPITAVLMPEVFPKTREWVLFFSSVLVSTATLLFSGVPAAVWERLSGDAEGDIPMWVWLGIAVLMTIPALRVLTAA